MIKMAENEELVDINDAANILGVSKLTLRNWDNSGTLKAVRIGSRGDRRYRRKDLDDFMGKSEKSQEINMKSFKKYIEENDFWIEEAPGLPLGLEEATKKMASIGAYFKPGLKYCIFSFEKDYMKQALSIQESIESCRSQFKYLKEDPEKIERFLQDCRNSYDRMIRVLVRLSFINLKNFSQEELIKEFRKFSEEIGEFWKAPLAVEPLSPYFDHEYFAKFEKAIGDRSKAREAFSLLTLPTESSFVARERKDLLEIITKFFGSAKERNALMDMADADYLAEIKMNNPGLFSRISQHQQEYFWIQNSYGQWTVITINDFLRFIREAMKENSMDDLKRELQKIASQETIQKQEDALKRLKLSDEIVNELNYIKKVTWLKDERKEMILRVLHQLFSFLDEFERRTGIAKELIAHGMSYEIKPILEKSFDIDILKRRREMGFMVGETGDKLSIMTGNEAAILKSKVFPDNIKLDEGIHGSIACRGENSVVSGKVRIILDTKNQEITNNEILVTSMTRPEFVPLMRKALAVITDEGGITCHAAIVSREMNKPCIIGTKNATKILKNGDEVELKMNHGVIKIVKRS